MAEPTTEQRAYDALLERIDEHHKANGSQSELEALAGELASLRSSEQLLGDVLGCLHVINAYAGDIERWLGYKHSTPKAWAASIKRYRSRAHCLQMALDRALQAERLEHERQLEALQDTELVAQ